MRRGFETVLEALISIPIWYRETLLLVGRYVTWNIQIKSLDSLHLPETLVIFSVV